MLKPKLTVKGGHIKVDTDLKIENTTVLSASTLGSGVKDSSLTSLGNLSSLNIDGNLNQTSGQASLKALNVLSVSCGGNVSGTLTSPLQGSISSLGSLSAGLNVASGQTLCIAGNTVLSSTALAPSVTSSSLTSVGNLEAVIINGDLRQTSGSAALKSLTVPSIACSGSVGGTLTTAAQPAISSLGELSSGLNIAAGQVFNIDGTTLLSYNSLAPSITTSSLTSVGGLSSLSLSGGLVQSSGTATLVSLDVASQSKFKCLNDYLTVCTLTGDTVTASWNSGQAFYATANGNNLTLQLTNVPTPSSPVTYSITLVIDCSSLKSIVTAVTINGVGVTPLFTTGSSTNLDLSAATVVIQSFVLVYTTASSTPWKCITHVGGDPRTTSQIITSLNSLAVSGDADVGSSTLRVDSYNSRVGVKTTAPSEALDVTGNVVVSGLIVRPTSLVTYTNSHVGYTKVYAATSQQSTLTSSNFTTNTLTKYMVNYGNYIQLVKGIWRIDVKLCFSASTAGTQTITILRIGVNAGSGAADFATYSATDTGYKYEQKAVSYAVSAGVGTSFINDTAYTQVLKTNSLISNFYGVFAGTWSLTAGGATLNLTTGSYVQITRLA